MIWALVIAVTCALRIPECRQPKKSEQYSSLWQPCDELRHNKLFLRVRPDTSEEARQAVIDEWYRGLLKQTAAPLIAQWPALIGEKVKRVFVQRMKTRWGSCNHRAGTIATAC